ncbi:hypothetical protein Pint_34201 [Pistacia integerrima]|uniref:Uncharacterized protein n=1 Tax=Pistacia integerrima TaxID=434235 RepID=A0ACC0X4S7_9ROSI|nr:hypothetical protein Pint_34201 [Pistacia integerrima]
MQRLNATVLATKRRAQARSYLSRYLLGSCITRKVTSLSRNFASETKPKPDVYSPNKKISHLIRTNRLSEARAVFDKTVQRNAVTWNAMINGYVKFREMAKARQLFDIMPRRDVVSWNLMISGYISCRGSGFLEEARLLFDKMPKRDSVSWNTMISGYAKNGMTEAALRVFNEMPESERNVVSWNALISGFLQNGDVARAMEFFEKMPERDSASLSALVAGLIKNGELDEAGKILVKFGNRNVVSWNSMIMCYVKAGDIVSAREIFDQMVERDSFSWNTMISGYVHLSNMEEASNLFGEMPNPDTHSWNTMISGYAQMGNLELARDFFERMPQKNLVSWNSMIAGCERNEDYKGAIELFSQMQVEVEKPDWHTLSSVLSVSTQILDLHLGMQIHQLVTKKVIPDLPINNGLITMYSRCGAITEARSIFDEMKLQRSVISWNAMIGGYTSHGFATEALQVFKLMKSSKVLPTYITFISVLSACAHAGLVEEGRGHFKSMISEYAIEPRIEHFAALVDIVGRHGHLEEAMDLIKNMPFEPDKAVWGALLGACRVHNNVELARVAAEALMKLEPESSTPYVLLYNMYADVGRWDDATQLRVVMKNNNIKKPAGSSWVDSSHHE